MPISPADFYSVAVALKNGQTVPQGEACDRSIIGRAYYAAYLALRQALRNSYGLPDADVDHGELRKKLSEASDPEVAEIGGRLKTLWKRRRVADYEPQQSMKPLETVLLLSNADFILKAARRIERKIPPGINVKS